MVSKKLFVLGVLSVSDGYLYKQRHAAKLYEVGELCLNIQTCLTFFMPEKFYRHVIVFYHPKFEYQITRVSF